MLRGPLLLQSQLCCKSGPPAGGAAIKEKRAEMRLWIVGMLVLMSSVVPAAAQSVDRGQPAEMGAHASVVSHDGAGASKLQDTEEPLGVKNALEAYDRQMSQVAQDTCEKLSAIARSVREGKISNEQAEYDIGMTYALGLMQFQMLSSLREIISYEESKNKEHSSRSKDDHADTNSIVSVRK